jgi:hypothetical protein
VSDAPAEVDDDNGAPAVFVHDLRRDRVRLVSVDAQGRQAPSGGKRGVLSADGRVAAFMTHGRFGPDDRDTMWDVYSPGPAERPDDVRLPVRSGRQQRSARRGPHRFHLG